LQRWVAGDYYFPHFGFCVLQLSQQLYALHVRQANVN